MKPPATLKAAQASSQTPIKTKKKTRKMKFKMTRTGTPPFSIRCESVHAACHADIMKSPWRNENGTGLTSSSIA